MFRLRITPDDEAMAVDQCCDIITGFAEANLRWISKHPEVPCCLSCAGVQYVPPQKCTPSGLCQDLYDAATILRLNKATCADAVAYEVAAHAAKGEPCRVVIVHQRDELGNPIPRRYHALLEHENGRIEDVAQKLIEHADGSCQTPACPGPAYGRAA